MKLDSECALTVEAPTLEKYGAIRSMIIVEIRRNQPRSNQFARKTAVRSKTRHGAANPILCPESGRDETEYNQRDSTNNNASLHRFQPMIHMLMDIHDDRMKCGPSARFVDALNSGERQQDPMRLERKPWAHLYRERWRDRADAPAPAK